MFRTLGAVAILLVLAESVARLAGVQPAHLRSGRVRRPLDRCMEWKDASGAVVMQCTNELGLVGPLPKPGDRRIIALGSSTTECPFMAEERTWPVLVQRQLEAAGLHVWVGNAGVGGSTAIGQAIFLEDHLLRLAPERVLFMPGANDRRPFSPGQDGGLVITDHAPWYDALLRHSRAFAWAQRRIARRGRSIPDRATMDERACTTSLKSRAWHLQQQPEFRQRVLRVVQLCHHQQVQLTLITQPVGCGANTPAFEEMEQYNATVRAIAREHGLPLIDLSLAEWPLDTCFLDAIHFSPEGAQRASAVIAPALLRALNAPPA